MKASDINNRVRQLIVESKVEKLTHLEHVEDLVYNNGHEGALLAVSFLNDIRRMLEHGAGSPTKISIKWDGSPTIVVGTDPEDGKFFIGTKSVFSKGTPKVIKSPKDVTKFYGDAPDDLKIKLLTAFKYLKQLGIGKMLQGDLLFVDSDKMEDVIDGEKVITFTPNVITYAVPIDSLIGQRIKKAKLGIIFHTSYEGPTLPEMVAKLGANIQGLNEVSSVWYDDATYKDLTGRASLAPKENEALISSLDQLRNTINKITPAKFNIILQNKEFARFVKPYINSLVWARTPMPDPIKFLKGYVNFYKKKMLDQIALLKGGPDGVTAKNRLYKIKQQEGFIEDNMNTMLAVLAIYQQLANLKLMFLKKLGAIESMVSTFKKDDSGYKVVAPEGFVVIGHYGHAVKLVDRLAFSADTNERWNKK